MPNFLVLDPADGAQCSVVSYTNASPTKIGDSFGAAYAGNTLAQLSHHVVQLGGQLYAMASDGIYKKDDPTIMTGPWTSQISFVNQINVTSIVGMFAMEINGVMSIVGLYPSDFSGRWRWVKFDGTTWTQAATTATVLSNNPSISSCVVYHNVIYWVGAVGGNSGRAFSYDPSTDSFSDLSTAYSGLYSTGVSSLCVYDDRLLLIGSYDSGASRTYRLSEFNGSTWVSLQTFEPFTNAISWAIGKWTLFTDGPNMWAIVGDDSGGIGWRCFEWDTALVRSEVTAAVLPTALRWTGAAGGAWSGNIGTARFADLYDLNSVIGVTNIFLYHASNGTAGTGFAMYRWNGNASLMTTVDSGGSVEHSLPHSQLSMGERIFTAGEFDVQIINRIGVLGGQKISFTVTGGGTGRTWKLYYTLKGTPPLLEATLIGPVTGGTATLNVGLNQVEGIAADGVTVYTVVWNVGADGLDANDRVIHTPLASV